MLEAGVVDAARLEAVQAEANEVVTDAMRFAEASPMPAPEALYQDVYAEEAGA